MNHSGLADILSHELSTRKGNNPAYSLRSFARDLGVSPSYLSGMLTRKFHASEKMAERFLDALKVPADERKHYIEIEQELRKGNYGKALVFKSGIRFSIMHSLVFHALCTESYKSVSEVEVEIKLSAYRIEEIFHDLVEGKLAEAQTADSFEIRSLGEAKVSDSLVFQDPSDYKSYFIDCYEEILSSVELNQNFMQTSVNTGGILKVKSKDLSEIHTAMNKLRVELLERFHSDDPDAIPYIYNHSLNPFVFSEEIKHQ